MKYRHDADGSEDNEKAKVYTYFDHMSKKVLREIGRYSGRRSIGDRPDYVLRNYRFVIYKKMGRDVLSLISNHARCPSLDNFVRSMELTGGPPSDDDVDAQFTRSGDVPEGVPSNQEVEASVGVEVVAGLHPTRLFRLLLLTSQFLSLRG